MSEPTLEQQIAWLRNAIRASEGNNDCGDVVLGNQEADAILTSLTRLREAEARAQRVEEALRAIDDCAHDKRLACPVCKGIVRAALCPVEPREGR